MEAKIVKVMLQTVAATEYREYRLRIFIYGMVVQLYNKVFDLWSRYLEIV